MPGRTFAIGDIHGDGAALSRLLDRLPPVTAEDTLLFVGDYVDRGPDSLGVVERVKALVAASPAKVVALRGNHEDQWVACLDTPDYAFLVPRANGCVDMYCSVLGMAPLGDHEYLTPAEMGRFLDVPAWLPEDLGKWMAALPTWYEDDHAIYVHAGLDGEGDDWLHPREGRERPLMWMREPDFYTRYRGKRVVFGHTPVGHLPTNPANPLASQHRGPKGAWMRGDLLGIDTGCGKGGFLTAIELPSLTVYESRG